MASAGFLRKLCCWLLGLLGLLAVIVYVTGRSYGFFRPPVHETDRIALPDFTQSPVVLVFSKTNAFIHREAIAEARQVLQAMAATSGWSLYFTDSGAVFNPEDLARFDAVVWNNVTGDVLNAAQRRAFEQYIEGGGGFVGIHGAGDGSAGSNWPWYAQLIGARFIGHPMFPQFQIATLRREDPTDPITRHLGESWERSDEWYSFAESPRGSGARVLVTLDESTYRPEAFGRSLRMGDDHPIIWKRCVGRGRAFYSALGHTAESIREPAHQTLLRNAIAWAAGIGGIGCGGPESEAGQSAAAE